MRAALIQFHQSRVADHIRGQDRGQPSFPWGPFRLMLGVTANSGHGSTASEITMWDFSHCTPWLNPVNRVVGLQPFTVAEAKGPHLPDSVGRAWTAGSSGAYPEPYPTLQKKASRPT